MLLTFGSGGMGSSTTNQPDGMCFDASGNILAQTNATCPPTAPTHSYDAGNNMTAFQGSSGAGGYVYDANGRRVKKCLPNCTSPTSSTVYVFSGGKDIAEYDNGAAPASPSREYIYSGSGLLTTLTSASTTYHHSDHLSVRLNTDANGTKIGEQGHFPYGESWYNSNTTTKFVFTSYERDSESGNDYAMAREYLVALGRYSSADPVTGSSGDPQSWNRYVYVRDNPVNMADPSGLSWLSSFFKMLIATFTFKDPTKVFEPTPSDDPWHELDNVLRPPMQLPAGGIIKNFHDENGITVGDFDGEPNTTCLTNINVTCTWWNEETKQMDEHPHTPADRAADAFAKAVAKETLPLIQATNCFSAAALPFMPVMKPEDFESMTGLGEHGADLSAEAAESQADQLFEDVDKLKRWHKAYVPTRNAANAFTWLEGGMRATSTLFSAREAWEQSEGCLDQ
jgi:RHS repeat-associated protein